MRRSLAPQLLVPLLCSLLGALAPAGTAHAQGIVPSREQAPAPEQNQDENPPPPEAPRSRLIARDSVETVVSDTSDEAGFLSVAPLQVAGARGRRYTGRRVDIDLRDADIHNVLRLLAEVGNGQHRRLRTTWRRLGHDPHAQRPVGPARST
jgi:hypothetical protein